MNRKLVHLRSAGGGQGVHRPRADLTEWFFNLSERLRHVRVCCGDWTRVLGPSPTFQLGLTGVFLDPPYSLDERADIYLEDVEGIAIKVREWAIENGSNPLMRIALCGYESEHAMPEDWQVVAWKANGGYGLQGEGRGRDNRERERIWFSPSCLTVRQEVMAL